MNARHNERFESIWTPERSGGFDEFVTRAKRRSFADGPIGDLLIQEYWHPDVDPPGSEQEITFYVAPIKSFQSIDEFAMTVSLFRLEDSIAEAHRRQFAETLQLSEMNTARFEEFWAECAWKVSEPPRESPGWLDVAYLLSDEWSDKFYVAGSGVKYYAVSWSTTA